MLKVTLTPGAGLDRALESASKGFYAVLEEAGRAGFLRVHSYPGLDPLAASAIVFLKALNLGVDVIVSVDLQPPPRIGEPSVLIGFDNLNYKVGDVRSKFVAFYSGDLRSIPVHGATYVDGPGSHSALSYLVATGAKEHDPGYVIAFLAGAYSSRFVDRFGRFQGLDRAVLDKLKLSTRLSLEMVTTIKGYKPHIRGVCESLSLTLNPYYPGITGDYENCVRAFNSLNLSDIPDVKLTSLDQKMLEKAVVAIVNTAKRDYNVELQPDSIVGGILVSTAPSYPAVDFREVADVLAYSGEALRDLGRVLVTLIDVENEYPMVESRFESYPKRLKELLVQLKPVKIKGNLRIHLYELQLERGDSPLFIWRALRTLGLLEQESILAFRDDEGLKASPFQVEEALDQGGCRRLQELGVARLEEGFLKLESPRAQR